MKKISIAVMGGSGLYQMDELKNPQEHWLDTPFGKTSDAIITGQISGIDVAFLARHGRGHRLIPSEVPYLANIYALKTLGVRYLISISAVGSLKEEVKPLDMLCQINSLISLNAVSIRFLGKVLWLMWPWLSRFAPC